MKKRLVLTGIISLLLVFGMMVMACGNKGSGDPTGGGDYDLIPISGITGEQVYVINPDGKTLSEYSGSDVSITAALSDPEGDMASKSFDGFSGSITAGKLTLHLPVTVPSDKLFSSGLIGCKWANLALTPHIDLVKITADSRPDSYEFIGIDLTYMEKAGSYGGVRWEAGWHYFGDSISGFKWVIWR